MRSGKLRRAVPERLLVQLLHWRMRSGLYVPERFLYRAYVRHQLFLLLHNHLLVNGDNSVHAYSGPVADVAAFVLVCARFFIGLTFARAGISKIIGKDRFRLTVKRYEIVPARAEAYVTVIVPWLEVILGGALLAGLSPHLAAILLAVFSLGFMGAVITNLGRGRVFDCGCGVTTARDIGWGHVASNAALSLSAVAVAVACPSDLTILAKPPILAVIDTSPGIGVPTVLCVILAWATLGFVRNSTQIKRSARTLAS